MSLFITASYFVGLISFVLLSEWTRRSTKRYLSDVGMLIEQAIEHVSHRDRDLKEFRARLEDLERETLKLSARVNSTKSTIASKNA